MAGEMNRTKAKGPLHFKSKFFLGIVVAEVYDEPEQVNVVADYGDVHYLRPKTTVLSSGGFAYSQPGNGRYRLASRFPLGTRLWFQRFNNTVLHYEVLGAYNFNHARCLRGVGENQYVCFVDLLAMTLPLPVIGFRIPPGVAFFATLGYELSPVRDSAAPYIRWFIKDVHRVTFESSWPLRGVVTYQPEPDYNRKFEPVSYMPKCVLVYLGSRCFLSHREEVRKVWLGLDYGPETLTPGLVYTAMVAQSRCDRINYTYRKLELTKNKDLEEMQVDLVELCRMAQNCTPFPFEQPLGQFGGTKVC